MADLKLNTESGSVTLVPENGSGNVDVTIPRVGVGKVLQQQSSDFNGISLSTTTSTSYISSGMSITVTPSAIGSKIYVTFNGNFHRNTTNGCLASIYANGVNLHNNNTYAAGTFVYGNTGTDVYSQIVVDANITTTDLTPITFTFYYRSWTGGLIRINHHAGEFYAVATEIAN